MWHTSMYDGYRRLPNSFVGECLGYFRCLCVVYGCVIAFIHQQVKDFVHKIPKHKFIRQSFNYHIQLWQIGNVAHLENLEYCGSVLKCTIHHVIAHNHTWRDHRSMTKVPFTEKNSTSRHHNPFQSGEHCTVKTWLSQVIVETNVDNCRLQIFLLQPISRKMEYFRVITLLVLAGELFRSANSRF